MGKQNSFAAFSKLTLTPTALPREPTPDRGDGKDHWRSAAIIHQE
jgi:hypothetical protein